MQCSIIAHRQIGFHRRARGYRLIDQRRFDRQRLFQRFVNRALVGDFQQPHALLGGQIAFQRDHADDAIAGNAGDLHPVVGQAKGLFANNMDIYWCFGLMR